MIFQRIFQFFFFFQCAFGKMFVCGINNLCNMIILSYAVRLCPLRIRRDYLLNLYSAIVMLYCAITSFFAVLLWFIAFFVSY